jgi:hypothetical protein
MDYKERHRMFMFWQTKFYSTARACDVCGFDRGASGPAKPERYMSRDEYCGTCHQKILKISSIHSRHNHADNAATSATDNATAGGHAARTVKVGCVDCHPGTPTRDGKRYSIHDHKFDFSGPELECGECHDLSDKSDRYFKNPARKHDFHFSRLPNSVPMTMEEACKKCHPDKDVEETLSKWKNESPAGH